MAHSRNIKTYTNSLTFLIEELDNVSAKRQVITWGKFRNDTCEMFGKEAIV